MRRLLWHDANLVHGRLWQGSFPEPSTWLPDAFGLLVLAAEELQPPANLYFGTKVVRVMLQDGPIDQTDMADALHVAGIVRSHLDRDENVLVTCAAGLNRSGLISAIALMSPPRWRRNITIPTLHSLSASKAVRLIKQARGPQALTNQFFLQFLTSLSAS